MTLLVDHVTIAGSDLATLQKGFADVGLVADYGGVHSNGVTHMAALGFEDGSYLELISTVEPGKTSPWWPEQIAAGGGPCAWCARTENLPAECARLAGLGLPVRGPVPYSRARPDGTRIEWDLAFIGPGEPGSVLPFLIEDRTPRTDRVRTSAGVAGTGLTGVARVVIGVRDLLWNTQLFERVYGWVARESRPDLLLDATVVVFSGAPVALAAPASKDSWLAGRLAQFGDSPAALLLQSRDLALSQRRLPAATRGSWLHRPALWLDPLRVAGTQLGIIQEAA